MYQIPKISVFLAAMATVVQFYDYALFGLSAAALSKAFIPNPSVGEQFMGLFSIMSAAALLRPFGSVFFGYIGDKYGRSVAVKISVALAAIATLSIGLIPSYASIYTAVLLTFVRMIFMFSMPGEGDGVRIYITENVLPQYECLGNGLVTFSSQIGVLLAGLAWFVANYYDPSMDYELWKVNFLIGGCAGLIVFILRNFLYEDYVYRDSYKKLIHKKGDFIMFMSAIVLSGCIGGLYHFQIIFFPVFISKMVGATDLFIIAKYNVITIMIYALVAVAAGFYADKVGSIVQVKYAVAAETLLLILATIAHYYGFYEILMILWFISSITLPIISVPLQVIIKRSISSNMRLKYFSLSHSLGSLIFSTTTPLISTWLWYYFNISWLPSLYIAGISVLLSVVFYFTDFRKVKY